ncbi:YaeQ family protein [Catenovulum sediminis]|uniref:YaeQ family protein n=1 Tax=Catenovulum sediminis TaxID=1740262 RepID=A0ABV1RKN1_9ALTE|nr:YaeQ family protein [Catenovulum sediminis]
MADGSLVIKAQINVSHVDSQNYCTRSEIIAAHQSESHRHLVQRLLAWALFRHANVKMSHAICIGDEPDLFVRRNDVQFEHWIEVDQLVPERLEKAEAKSEHVWLFYCDPSKVDKLLKNINKHPCLQLVQYSPDLIDKLSQQITKQINWSVMVDHDLLTVATDDVYLESEIHLIHPLTIPALDLIH